MDDFYVFLKNDRNFCLRQLHFVISVISFIFLILTNTVDSVIIALAIPGAVLNSALLLGLYCIDARHDITDIEILISYGILNLLAAMIFMNKLLQMDISIFRMLFLNSYTINILLCLCSGLLMLGEGIHRLIVILVRNIYNSTHNSHNMSMLLNQREPNSSINITNTHKNTSPEIDSATNTTPSISLPANVITYAEKDTNTNPFEDILIGRNSPLSLPIYPKMISNTVKEYTECSHYRLNSEHDEHRGKNSGDSGYTETDRHSGDGIHCKEKPFINEEPMSQVENYFYPKSQTIRPIIRNSKNLNSSGLNEDGLPVFVDRYGKRYIASLARGMQSHLCSANAMSHTRSPGYDTSSGDFKKKASTPINEYYTNRTYSNSKVTITPSKDEVNTYDSIDSKATQDSNVESIKHDIITNHKTNNNNIRVANNEPIPNLTNTPINKEADSNDFLTNYSNYLAQLYKQNSNNDKKTFNYKFYDHNYDYQWVCEA